MNAMLTNWQTSLVGLLLIALGLLEAFLGLKIPGFTMDPGAALTMGLGFLVAKDAAPSPAPSVKVVVLFAVGTGAAFWLVMVQPARAGDINAPATKSPASNFSLGTYPTLNGVIVGLYTEGGGSSVNASAPGVPAASITTTTAAIGVTVGYMWTPKGSPVSLSFEGDLCAQNFNGNSSGFSLQGPLCFEERVMAFAPWQNLLAALPSFPNPFSAISAFAFPAGATPVGNSIAGIGGGFYGRDISTAFEGFEAGKVWRIDPEIFLALLLSWVCAFAASAEVSIPPLRGRVVDVTGT
jgi:hypothetical protein